MSAEVIRTGPSRFVVTIEDTRASSRAFCTLSTFIDETLQVLGTDAHEVLTERVAFLRNGAGPNDAEATKQVNDWFASGAH